MLLTALPLAAVAADDELTYIKREWDAQSQTDDTGTLKATGSDGNSFWGWILRFWHGVFYFWAHLFGLR